MPDAKEPIKAVVVTSRAQVRDAIRSALKSAEIGDDDIVYPEKPKKCLEALQETKRCIFVADWEFGTELVLTSLKSIRDFNQEETRVTFLLAAQLDSKIIAAGTEFGVNHIHTGEVTPNKIKLVIDNLKKELETVGPIKKSLIAVAEARTAGDWKKSSALLEQLREKNPDNERILIELGENYFHEGKMQECVDLLTPLSQKDNPNARVLHLIGRSMVKLGKNNEALGILKQAKVINPYNVERLVELGNILLRTDRVQEAASNFDQALELAPGNGTAKQGKGTCMLLDGDVNEALDLMKNSISGLELASVFNTAAVLSMRTGKIPEGMDLYDVAIRALKDQKDVMARLYFNKGIGFYRWKKLDDAKQCFETALKYDPNYTNASHNLNAIRAKAKDSADKKLPFAPVSTASLAFDDSLDDQFKKTGDDLHDEDEKI